MQHHLLCVRRKKNITMAQWRNLNWKVSFMNQRRSPLLCETFEAIHQRLVGHQAGWLAFRLLDEIRVNFEKISMNGSTYLIL